MAWKEWNARRNRNHRDDAATSVPEAVTPTLAATVVLLRDGEASAEVPLLRRNAGLHFGGAWVFPGGRIEPDDVALWEGDAGYEDWDADREGPRHRLVMPDTGGFTFENDVAEC